jgi:hypothetical protein
MNQFEINAAPINGTVEETASQAGYGPHVISGLAKLVEQFKDKVNIEKLLRIILDELDEIEVALTDIQVYKQIDQAYGYQLDQIGSIVGRTRDGYNDADYRSRLKLQIGINNSEGEADRILSVWKTLTNSTIVSMTESFPAALTLFAQTSTTNPSIVGEIERVSSAGVDLNYVISAGNPFTFFGGTGSGFGTTDNPALGGAFVSIT